ncbi:MAG: peptidoglycan-associated lipoprotein Pal [Chromatiales bacterium]|nr:peptidoglycan-associated lipoprotein Pal [Chromatiales bacterium]
MFNSKLVNAFALLSLAVLLGACVGTTEVDFEPVEPVATEVVIAEPAEEEVVVTEPPPPPPEIKAYQTDIVATAEQLYGTDPGHSMNIAYQQAVALDPTLGYTVIYFDFNRSQIKEDARDLLSRHASFMQENPTVRLRIEGHADQRGTSGYNLALGESRANAVRTLLVAYGIDSSRISIVSYGEEQPADDGITEEAFKLNRRAELIYP